MEFLITRTTDKTVKYVKEINTLEELLDFVHKTRVAQVVLSETDPIDGFTNKKIKTPKYHIEIYDGFREK